MYHAAKLPRRKKRAAHLRAAIAVLSVLAGAAWFYVWADSRVAAVSAPKPTVTVVYHGVPATAPAQNDTASQLLQRMGLELRETDVLSLPSETVMTEGMTLRVDEFRQQTEIFTIEVPAPTIYCRDNTAAEGQETVLSPGAAGEMRCTAEVEYVNGQEVTRRVLTREMTVEPTDRIMALGTGSGKDLPVIQNGYIWLPDGQMLTYTHTATVQATAFTHTDAGFQLSSAHRGTVAVDPNYIPYGTRLFIMAKDGSYIYGIAQASDCGSHLQGDRADLYLPTQEECEKFGKKECIVYYLG